MFNTQLLSNFLKLIPIYQSIPITIIKWNSEIVCAIINFAIVGDGILSINTLQ